MWTAIWVISVRDNEVILVYLSFSGDTEAVELLVGGGADINAKGSNESTPLILAANGGHVGVTELLLKTPQVSVHEQVW